MNEQFVNELAVALRKVGTIHAVGEEWHSYTGEIPVGGVPYSGQMVTRATYSALWAYAQEKGLVKTEAEWQQIATANGGNVPYYSSGDGSTTFRLPKIVGYVKGASSESESGDYIAEGLPNITGTTSAMRENAAYDRATGAFKYDGSNNSEGLTGGSYTKAVTSAWNLETFDASRCSPVYGNSNHVTPETSVVLFGVYAFGAIVETGALDATTLATGLSKVESNLATVDSRIEASNLVSEKCNQTITISGYNTEYITISGLIPYKPVYVAAKNITGKNTIDVIVTSGSVLDAPLSTSMVIQGSKNAVIWFPVIPTGTSLEIAVGDNSGSQVQSTVVAYQ